MPLCSSSAGGLASALAGLVVLRAPDGTLQRFDWIGYIVIAASLLALMFMYFVHRRVPEATDPQASPILEP